jgi:hypothetical protein
LERAAKDPSTNSAETQGLPHVQPVADTHTGHDRTPAGSRQDLVKFQNFNGLWDEAYKKVQAENPSLVAAYKKALLASDSQISARTGAQPSANLAESGDGEVQLQQLAKNKLDAIRNAQLKVTVGGEEIAVKDQVLKVVRTITAFKDFIGKAVSLMPR